MSLKDDLEVMELHQRSGQLRQWFRGHSLHQFVFSNRLPIDPTARSGTISYYTEFLRGD